MRQPTRVAIFGAGLAGQQLWMTLSRFPSIDVILFLDNDTAKHGTRLFGVPIAGISELSRIDWDWILVASMYHRAIAAQLRAQRVPARRIVVLGPRHDVRATLRARRIDVGRSPRVPKAWALRLAIFGASTGGLRAWEILTAFPEVQIVTFVDNDWQRWGRTFLGAPIVGPAAFRASEVDLVVVASVHATVIIGQLLELGVPPGQIVTLTMVQWLLSAAARRGGSGNTGRSTSTEALLHGCRPQLRAVHRSEGASAAVNALG